MQAKRFLLRVAIYIPYLLNQWSYYSTYQRINIMKGLRRRIGNAKFVSDRLRYSQVVMNTLIH